MSVTEHVVGGNGATGELGGLVSVIQAQAETIRDQQKTIDVLSGGRRISLALDQTIAEFWALHFATLPDVPWRKSVASIMKFFLSKCGGIKLGDFTARTWETFREAPETRERYGETSLNIILTRLKIAANRAVDAGELHENPLRKVKFLRGPGKRRTEVSESDEKLIADDLDPCLRTLFIVSLDSLMRREEVRILQWEEIDFEGRVVRLSAKRSKGREAGDAFLTTRAIRMLRALPRYPDCPWVFANPATLRPWGKTHVWNHFRRAIDDNGIKAAPGDGRPRFHDITRRTGARRLVRLGASLTAVQKIMRHKQMATTLEYVDAGREEAIAAHALLEKATRRPPVRAPGSASAATRGGRRATAA